VPSLETMQAPTGVAGEHPASNSGHWGGSMTPRSTSPMTDSSLPLPLLVGKGEFKETV